MRTIRVVVIDDDVIVRQAVATLLDRQRGFSVSQFSAELSNAVQRTRLNKPEIVLVNLASRDHETLRLVAHLHQAIPTSRIIVTGLRSNSTEVAALVRAGAQGFILIGTPLKQFLGTIRAVASGRKALPRELASVLLDEIAHRLPARSATLVISPLTRREMDVVQLVCEGLPNKAIASRLNVTTATVKSHVHSILKKHSLSSRTQIAALASTGVTSREIREAD